MIYSLGGMARITVWEGFISNHTGIERIRGGRADKTELIFGFSVSGIRRVFRLQYRFNQMSRQKTADAIRISLFEF